MASPAVYDHVRPTGTHPDGVYRVVGVTDERVTLLRVADADGRRAHTGETLTVPLAEFEQFDTAENPDGNRSLGAALAAAPKTAYWSVRAFVEQLLAHPGQAAVALAVLVAGAAGESVLPFPDIVFGVLIFAGALGLAYVGGGGF